MAHIIQCHHNTVTRSGPSGRVRADGLRARWEGGAKGSRCTRIVVVLRLRRYIKAKPDVAAVPELPPHPWSVADLAYQELTRQKTNQAVRICAYATSQRAGIGWSVNNPSNWFHSTRHSTAELFNARLPPWRKAGVGRVRPRSFPIRKRLALAAGRALAV